MSDDDDELAAELLALVELLIRRFDLARVAEMEAAIDDVPDIDLDGRCLLFGFEGQLDEAWFVPSPFPEILYRAVPPPPMRRCLRDCDDMPTPSLRTASYRRIGEFTYQRIE